MTASLDQWCALNEVEAKLIVNDDPDAVGRIREVLAGVGLKIGPATVWKSTDTYLDTRDRDLFRNGWTCRVRKGENESVLAMKKRGQSLNGITRREELESTVDMPPTSPEDIPPGPMRTVCEEATAGRPLEPLFSVEKKRQAFDVVSDSGWKGKAAFDEVSQWISKKKAGLDYREFELEILEGSDETLTSICELLESELDLTPARLNKFERGLREIESTRGAEQQEFCFQKNTTVADLAFGYLSRCFADMQREEPRAWEGIDTEGVHQMRVAIRRSRTTLKTFHQLFSDRAVAALEKDLVWLADTLGQVRDLDVYLQRVRSYADELICSDVDALAPYFAFLASERTQARRRLIRALDSRRFAGLKKRFERLLANNPVGGKAADESAAAAARRIILRAAKKLRRDGNAIDEDSPDERLHQLRIRGKRFRYVTELFVPVLGNRIAPTLRASRKLQDCLGGHHDAFVADAKLRAYAEQVPVRSQNRHLLLALGELVHVQTVSARSERAVFFRLWPNLSKEIRPGHLRKKRLSI